MEFENGITREYTVDPLRAALLGHFGEAKTDTSYLFGILLAVKGRAVQPRPSVALHLSRCEIVEYHDDVIVMV